MSTHTETKDSAYNLHFEIAKMTNYAYYLLEARTGAATWDFLSASSSVGKHSPGPQVYPALPGQSLASNSDLTILLTFFNAVSSRALDLIQPGQCDTQCFLLFLNLLEGFSE